MRRQQTEEELNQELTECRIRLFEYGSQLERLERYMQICLQDIFEIRREIMRLEIAAQGDKIDT